VTPSRGASKLCIAVVAVAPAMASACSQSAGSGSAPYGGFGGVAGTAGGGAVGGTGAAAGTGATAGTGAAGSSGTAGGAGSSGTGGAGGTGATAGTGAAGSSGTAGGAGSSGTGGAGGTGGNAGSSGTAGSGSCTPPVAGGACDTWPQCGCNAGMNCDVTGLDGKTACVLAGNVQPYRSCGAANACGAGYACIGGDHSVCKQFCESNADCAGSLRECLQVVYAADDAGTETPIPEYKVCSAGCALEDSAATCGPDATCYPNAAATATDCIGDVGTATGPNGCSSTDPFTCAPGYVCLADDSCKKWCRVGQVGDCPGSSCGGFSTPLILDGVTYGACL
jgi:hypothetical protein